jgi:hypothetical protein
VVLMGAVYARSGSTRVGLPLEEFAHFVA